MAQYDGYRVFPHHALYSLPKQPAGETALGLAKDPGIIDLLKSAGARR